MKTFHSVNTNCYANCLLGKKLVLKKTDGNCNFNCTLKLLYFALQYCKENIKGQK